MTLNLEFKEGSSHAWLVSGDSRELFVTAKPCSLGHVQGALMCCVESDVMEEVEMSEEGLKNQRDPDGIFVCVRGIEETKIYECTSHVRMPGGDLVAFIRPMMTTH